MRCGEWPGLEAPDLSPPIRLDAYPCIEDHEVPQSAVTKGDGFD